jgi:hypothetical protein
MGFIDDKNVCDRHGYLVGPNAARPQRLHGGDLHWVFQIDVQSGLNQAVINRQLERGLLQDLTAMGQDSTRFPWATARSIMWLAMMVLPPAVGST